MPSAACLMLKSSHACSALVSCASVSRNQKSSRFVRNAISAVRRLCGPFALLQTGSERLLPREFHSYKLESLSNRPDLEHSCSPIYAACNPSPRLIRLRGSRSERRRNAARHRCRAHLRHSLDASPARAACRPIPYCGTQAHCACRVVTKSFGKGSRISTATPRRELYDPDDRAEACAHSIVTTPARSGPDSSAPWMLTLRASASLLPSPAFSA